MALFRHRQWIRTLSGTIGANANRPFGKNHRGKRKCVGGFASQQRGTHLQATLGHVENPPLPENCHLALSDFFKEGGLDPGERHSRDTRNDGTVTLCTLRAATVLSRDCHADCGRPLTKKVMSHSRDGPGVTAPLQTNIVPLTKVCGIPPFRYPPLKVPETFPQRPRPPLLRMMFFEDGVPKFALEMFKIYFIGVGGTTLREALRENLPLRGLCGGLSEGSAGSLRGFCGVSAGFCRGPHDFPRFFGGSDPVLVTLGNAYKTTLLRMLH